MGGGSSSDLLPVLKGEGSLHPSERERFAGYTLLRVYPQAGSPAHYPYPMRGSGLWIQNLGGHRVGT
jgi:hypothetical protein